MNWYKYSQHRLEDFEDRNIVNHKIAALTVVAEALVKMSKLVFQTGSATKIMLQQVRADKAITNYPIIIEILNEADKVCLDSPHKFKDLVVAAAGECAMRVKRLEKDRKEFIQKILPQQQKGWFN